MAISLGAMAAQHELQAHSCPDAPFKLLQQGQAPDFSTQLPVRDAQSMHRHVIDQIKISPNNVSVVIEAAFLQNFHFGTSE